MDDMTITFEAQDGTVRSVTLAAHADLLTLLDWWVTANGIGEA